MIKTINNRLKRDASLLEQDIKNIIITLKDNFPRAGFVNCSSYLFSKKNFDESLFRLQAGDFVDEESFERVASALKKEFPKYVRNIKYTIGKIGLSVNNLEEYEISIKKYPANKTEDNNISKILNSVVPKLGDTCSFDDNYITQWHIDYANPKKIKLRIF